MLSGPQQTWQLMAGNLFLQMYSDLNATLAGFLILMRMPSSKPITLGSLKLWKKCSLIFCTASPVGHLMKEFLLLQMILQTLSIHLNTKSWRWSEQIPGYGKIFQWQETPRCKAGWWLEAKAILCHRMVWVKHLTQYPVETKLCLDEICTLFLLPQVSDSPMD